MMRTIFPPRAKDDASRARVKIMRLSCCLNLGLSHPPVHDPQKRIISDYSTGKMMCIISATSGYVRHNRVEGGHSRRRFAAMAACGHLGWAGGKCRGKQEIRLAEEASPARATGREAARTSHHVPTAEGTGAQPNARLGARPLRQTAVILAMIRTVPD